MNYRSLSAFVVVILLIIVFNTLLYLLHLFVIDKPITEWVFMERMCLAVMLLFTGIISLSKYSDIKEELFY